MTLREYAYRFAIWRELIAGFCINTLIMWAIFWGKEDIPVLGWFSIMMVVAPTCYCAMAFPTFFGIAAGVKRRQTGKSPPPLDKKFRWIWLACWRAFRVGFPTWCLGFVSVRVLSYFHPSLTVSGWLFVVLVPIIATPISAMMFVRALLSTERLGSPTPAEFAPASTA